MAIKSGAVAFGFGLWPDQGRPARMGTRTRPVDSAAQRFARALQHLEAGDWDEAYAGLSDLASQGHPAAARIALMLASKGTSLLGGVFAATARERARWQHHAER